MPQNRGSSGAAIRLHRVCKSFDGQRVLNDLSLEIEQGRTTVILGPSGCGKSVMLRHIVGLLKPDSGRIHIGMRRIDTASERDLGVIRRKIGFLFQMSALFDSLTVEENIAFPLIEHRVCSRRERHERVADVLDLVDLPGVQSRLPAELSGGQRKRVALARALVMNPSTMLYDEPTTGLDPIRADGINDLILKLRRQLDVTGLVVTHDLASAEKVGDRIVMLAEGRIAADGSMNDLRASSDPFVRQFLLAAAQPVAPPADPKLEVHS